ncbi:rRNA maturation RNase YbeY [Candidatus Campbellbacteria bacterium RIFCSPLOWO2_01_FULL_34_15]|uniref:Endoribonuclease YbeY n=2 Tax=Candidatus Campbelliibacteriota TaxID=1752727 RepID=A0A1F5EPA6_9BACT|nr:MAG: rRNA maturation RNase YbeY [Candidatus Campbellbacteria bacterium RIFCSPHIGHO2_01_FULL_34_10]OGD69237.1 MAG: rRNA maturation RNase YbeY [Candidatus Campbellbacteria bacterium RIFCSPLOWO2_01_FULL_34_15]
MKKSEETISIKNQTKGKLPSLPFENIKNKALGKKYELSLVFIGDKLSKRLNTQYRGKNSPTNILSFPLSEDSGEIFINYKLAEKQAKKYEREFSDFIGFLFIHGLIHLKGFEHSSRMEEQEDKIRKFFNL